MRPAQITDQHIHDFITAGLYEDIREGDHTSLATIPADHRSRAALKIKDYGVVAGVELAGRIIRHLDPTAEMTVHKNDGTDVFYGEKAIDRSPCGTGTSARLAQWVQRGRLGIGEDFVHESIIGSRFTGRAEETVQVGPYPGIVPSIEGWARVTGINTIFIEDDCPFREGFQVI